MCKLYNTKSFKLMFQIEITRHLELADSLRFIITSRAVFRVINIIKHSLIKRLV